MQGWRSRAASALAVGIAFLAIGCSDQASITDSLVMKKGPPVTEAGSNNLSFPVIWSDGVAPTDFQALTTGWTFAPVLDPLTDCVGEDGTQLDDSGAVPDSYLCYFGRKNTGLDEVTGVPTLVGDSAVWLLQERAANKWQMFHAAAQGPFVVSAVDFGDLLESASLKQRQIRTEVALFLDATDHAEFGGYVAADWAGSCVFGATPDNCFGALNMSGAVPFTDQSINEVQGTDYPIDGTLLDPTTVKSAVTTDGTVVPVHATVYPRCSRLLIQRITGVPAWNPTAGTWSGGDDPAVNLAASNDQYTAEINAGGSMIFGYNWKTKGIVAGTYRLTFVIDGPSKCTASKTVFDATTRLVNEGNLNAGTLIPAGDAALNGGDEGGVAFIDIYAGR